MNKRITVFAAAFCLGVPSAYADDSTYDPRSLAMGGTGVATSNARNAAFQDPAMLASTPRDKFALELPIVSVRLQDENQMLSNVQTLKDNANQLTSAIQAFQTAQAANNVAGAQAAAASASVALNGFNSALTQIDHKSLMADLFAGSMLGVPGNSTGFALYVDAHAEAGAMFNYAAADQTTITNLSTNLSSCAAGNAAGCTYVQNNTGANGQVNNLQSQLLVRGVLVKELGISAAHHFESLGGWDIGITPKMQQLKTYDYAVAAQQGATISLNQGEKGYSAFNMDAGAIKGFKRDNNDEVKAGVVVKNMMSKSFTTILGDHIDIKPQVTVGASYLTKLTTVGLDVDAISNKPIVSGFSKESQYVRLGAEFDAWRWAQVRIGYRHDLKGNYPNLPSFGLGFSPFGVHMDLSVAYAGQKERAVSFQTGFAF